jgi:DNA-binding response OmpR family regulator
VLLTAKAQEEDVQKGYEAGADAYVRKPFSAATLTAEIERLLGQAGGR